MMMHCERSTRRLSPRVKVALSRIPSSSCHSESEAFSISSNSRIESFRVVGVPLVERFLGEQRMGFAVAQVARRRADQLGDFVGVLKFGAVNLDAGARVAEEGLGHGFDDPGFPRAGGAEEQQIANWTSRRIQSRQKHLVDFDHFLDGLVLTDDSAAKGAFKLSGIIAAARRVKHGVDDGFHRVCGPFFLSWARIVLGERVPPSRNERATNFVTSPSFWQCDYCKPLAIPGEPLIPNCL